MLPGPPVALRAFPQNDEIALFAEVYDNAGATPHKVDITTTVTTDEGKVLFKTDEVRDSTDLRRQARRLRLHDARSAEGSGARQLRAEGRSAVAAEGHAAGRARAAVHGGGAAAGAGAMIAIILALAVMFAQSPAERKARMNDMILEAPSTQDDREGRPEQRRRRAGRCWCGPRPSGPSSGSSTTPDRPRPAVDFSKEMVVGVFMGSRPNAGFSIDDRQRHARGDGALIVRYTRDDARPRARSARRS